MKVINLKEPKFKLPHSDSIYISRTSNPDKVQVNYFNIKS